MTNEREKPAECCESCAHVSNIPGPGRDLLLTCHARRIHVTGRHNHCKDWAERPDEGEIHEH